jgi:hypothetical protein
MYTVLQKHCRWTRCAGNIPRKLSEMRYSYLMSAQRSVWVGGVGVWGCWWPRFREFRRTSLAHGRLPTPVKNLASQIHCAGCGRVLVSSSVGYYNCYFSPWKCARKSQSFSSRRACPAPVKYSWNQCINLLLMEQGGSSGDSDLDHHHHHHHHQPPTPLLNVVKIVFVLRSDGSQNWRVS